MYNFIYGKDYWIKAGKNNPVHEICYNWDLEMFKTVKSGIWFTLDVESVVSNKNTNFLEIGCGLGRIAHWVAPHVKKYIGIDISSTMIEGAKEYNKQFEYNNCEFLECSNLLENFKEETFDIIYTELVFIHLTKEEQEKYINDSYKLLKKTGIFCVQIPKYPQYINGFDEKEIANLLSSFKILKTEDTDLVFQYLCEK